MIQIRGKIRMIHRVIPMKDWRLLLYRFLAIIALASLFLSSAYGGQGADAMMVTAGMSAEGGYTAEKFLGSEKVSAARDGLKANAGQPAGATGTGASDISTKAAGKNAGVGGTTSSSGFTAEAPAKSFAGSGDITFIEDKSGEDVKAGASPFADGPLLRKEAVPGYVELSTGMKLPGKIYTTRDRLLKIFNLNRQVYDYVPVPALTEIEVVVEWERVDKEWRFKEPGNPEKIYTGRSYPVRMLLWRLTLRNGHQITGHIAGQPIYVENGGQVDRFILHKRDKGLPGTDLKDLVYVHHVVFGEDAYNRAVAEVREKASAEGRGAAGKKAAAGEKSSGQGCNENSLC